MPLRAALFRWLAGSMTWAGLGLHEFWLAN